MKVWMIWVQGDDATWLEAAWDDEMTAQNGPGWEAEVDRVAKFVHESKYVMRIAEVEIPGVYELFDLPKLTATEVRSAQERQEGADAR